MRRDVPINSANKYLQELIMTSYRDIIAFFLVVLMLGPSADAFRPTTSSSTTTPTLQSSTVIPDNDVERRDFLSRVASMVAGTTGVMSLLPVAPAYASGGATAGGAYLLSAKVGKVI